MQPQPLAPVLRFSDHPSTATPRHEDARVTVIVVTRERPRELAGVIRRLRLLPEQPRLIVLDNASDHAVAVAHIAMLNGAELVRCEQNFGAAACNQVVANVTTPNVAFCDDGTWWSDGSLRRACDLMEEYPHIGAVNGRVLVGSSEMEHPRCRQMQHSELDRSGLPGPALISFMANAVVMRTRAFRHAEGYEPRAFAGAEEALIGLSLVALGWRIVYAPDVTLHQIHAAAGNAATDPVKTARNRLWVAWLRLPWRDAWRDTRAVLSEAWHGGRFLPVLWQSLRPLSWLILRRRAVPEQVARMHRIASSLVDEPARAQPSSKPVQGHHAGRPTDMPPC